MSQNISMTDTLCDSCVHKSELQNNGSFLCQLLEKELLKGETSCEDWEENVLNENSAYECD